MPAPRFRLTSRSGFARRILVVLIVLGVPSPTVVAQAISPLSATDAGVLHVPAMDVPFSTLASPEARVAFIATMARARDQHGDPTADIAKVRAATSAYFAPLVAKSAALYPVVIRPAQIGGIRVDVVTPRSGVSRENRHRILINLHGGGFFTGAGAGGLAEAVPIAGLGRITVVTVDYRQGPENKFPAASEDVAAVYKALLKRHPAKTVGLYGGSAGGVLTAEAVVWMQKHDLPRPGAVALISASAGGWAGGDSTYFAPMSVVAPSRVNAPHFPVSDAAYFSDADMNDPLVAPINAPVVLAQFPPTLVITGTRDVSLSAAVHTHAELVRLGVDADLHVLEGVGHAFFTDPSLPESSEAYAVIVTFFDRHLAR